MSIMFSSHSPEPFTYSAYLGIMGEQFSVNILDTLRGNETLEEDTDPLIPRKFCC